MKRAPCITFSNHKGGTGKTTACINVAGFLAKMGHSVLVVDFDPQANASSGLGVDTEAAEYSVFDAILNKFDPELGVSIRNTILETEIENLYLVPAELDLGVIEVYLQHAKGKATMLARCIEEVRQTFDYILVDTPSGSGLLMINGLVAADQVIVPVDTSIYSLDAIKDLKTYCDDVLEMTGHDVGEFVVLLNRFIEPSFMDKLLNRTSASLEVEKMLGNMNGKKFVVPESKDVFEGQLKGEPLALFAANSKAGRVFKKVANHIIENKN